MNDEPNPLLNMNAYHDKARKVLFPNETWEDIEKERISKFNKYEKEEKAKKSDKKDIESRNTISSALKNLFRFGIPCHLRTKYWLLSSGGQVTIDYGFKDYESMKSRVISENFLQTSKNPFGVPIEYIENFCGYNEDIIIFIQVIYYYNRNEVEFAPFIPRVCFVLLTFLKDFNFAYTSIQAMIINNSKKIYFETTYEHFNNTSLAIHNLCHSKVPKVYQHCQSLNVDASELFFMFIFGKPFLSTPATFTFFDSYINEGIKVFYRFFFQFLIQETKNILQANSANEIKERFEKFDELTEENAQLLTEFIKKSFNLPLSRSKIAFKNDHKSKSHSEMNNESNPQKMFTIGPNNLAQFYCIETNDEYSYEAESQTDSNSQSSKSKESPERLLKKSSNSKSELDLAELMRLTEIKKRSFIYSYSTLMGSMNEVDISGSSKHRRQKYRNKKRIAEEAETKENEDLPVVDQPKIRNTILPVNSILSDSELAIIWSHIPIILRSLDPTRVYKMITDGASFINFQLRVNENCPYLLLIRTRKRTVGAFLSDPPTNKSTANHISSSCSDTVPTLLPSNFVSFDNSAGPYYAKMVNNVRRPGKFFGRSSTFVFCIDHQIGDELDDANATDVDGNPSVVKVYPSISQNHYVRSNSNSSEAEEKSDGVTKKHFFRKFIRRKTMEYDNYNSSNCNDSCNDGCYKSNKSDDNIDVINSASITTAPSFSSKNQKKQINLFQLNGHGKHHKSHKKSDSKRKSEPKLHTDSDSKQPNDPKLNTESDSKQNDSKLNTESDSKQQNDPELHTENNDGSKVPSFDADNIHDKADIDNEHKKTDNDVNDNSQNSTNADNTSISDKTQEISPFTDNKEKNDNSNSSTKSDQDSKSNDLLIYSKFYISVFSDSLMIGGPDPAIFIEKYFNKLISHSSLTFNSPSFADHQNGDLISDIELYVIRKK